MEYQELLDSFAKKLGGEVEIKPDASGAVMLDVDGMPLSIMGMEELGLVALIGVIGEPPPEDRMERLYAALLEANHNFAGTAGATLSINPETRNISLCKTMPLALADADGFFNDVERFVNTLENWRKLVSDYRGAEIESKTASAPQADEALPLGGSGFMQV